MKIITFEGIDKSGKNTQATMLYNYLLSKGYRVEKAEFHNYGSPTGKLVRAFLDDEYHPGPYALEAIMAADKLAQLGRFEQLRRQGCDYLILDRYITSQYIFGIAKDADVDFITSLLDPLPSEDLEFLLDLPVEESMKRKGQHGKNDRYENDSELLHRARHEYLEYFHEMNRSETIIDAMQSPDKMHEDIVSAFNKLI